MTEKTAIRLRLCSGSGGGGSTSMTICAPTSYSQFLASKRVISEPCGFDVDPHAINPLLFPFQRDCTLWALRRGRAALFEDCGMGKGWQALEWARLVHEHTDRPVLILAPLAVSQQFVREGLKLGVQVALCRSQADVVNGVNVTNYEMIGHFDPTAFSGLVTDEASILKSYEGILRKQITDFASHVLYRLACTATPAPNDLIEIINQAEYLGLIRGKEAIALWFTQDGNTTHQWRLKGHAREDFWRWMASWSVAMRKPSDLGYSDDGFVLPPLQMHQITVDAPPPEGMLFAVEALDLSAQRQARRATMSQRVAAIAELVNQSSEQWIVWAELNDEARAIARAIPDAIEVTGSDSITWKEQAAVDFQSGKARVLVSKSLIYGHGLNLQNCHHVAFAGATHSFEQWYQAIRRCWRFGQTQPVRCYLVVSDADGPIVRNLERKEQQAAGMMENIVRHMAGLSLGRAERAEMDYQTNVATGKGWTLYLGDCVEEIDQIETESIGHSVFSPPFALMYAYSNSARDMGNVTSMEEMLEQYRFLVSKDKLMRALLPGRIVAVHLSQIVTLKHRDGQIGLMDYRGALIRVMVEEGWIFHGEVTIDKDPQVKAARTKEIGLLFKTLAKDSSMCRPALGDYLLLFRKPGENPEPIQSGKISRYNAGGWITEREWIEWAHPLWTGIRETDVLNVRQARETDDERHLAPLQLGVIERSVKLWSNPGDLVLSPFAGIGSEGFVSLKLSRRFVGIELKRSYWESAIKNLQRAEREKIEVASRTGDLFSAAGISA